MAGETKRPNFSNEVDRRKFISVAAVTAGAMLLKPALVRGTAANSAVRVGLLGCGGGGPGGAAHMVGTGRAPGVGAGRPCPGRPGKPQKNFAPLSLRPGHIGRARR